MSFDTHLHDDRYFDVFIEYAQAGPEDILVKISAINRGPRRLNCICAAHLWFLE
jgi:hypothetical protein